MPDKIQLVTLTFAGVKSREMAKRFYTYLVDGGLEDQLIDRLTGDGVTLEIDGCDGRTLTVDFQCSKEKPAKKAAAKAKKPAAKKAPKKTAAKKAVKKTPARRTKKA